MYVLMIIQVLISMFDKKCWLSVADFIVEWN